MLVLYPITLMVDMTVDSKVKITIVDKTSKGSKEIEVDENLLGVMNHRDLTVDYRQGRQVVRFKMTEEGFNDLVSHFKKPEPEPEVEDVIETGKEPIEETVKDDSVE